MTGSRQPQNGPKIGGCTIVGAHEGMIENSYIEVTRHRSLAMTFILLLACLARKLRCIFKAAPGSPESQILTIFWPLARPKIAKRKPRSSRPLARPPRREAALAADFPTDPRTALHRSAIWMEMGPQPREVVHRHKLVIENRRPSGRDQVGC